MVLRLRWRKGTDARFLPRPSARRRTHVHGANATRQQWSHCFDSPVPPTAWPWYLTYFSYHRHLWFVVTIVNQILLHVSFTHDQNFINNKYENSIQTCYYCYAYSNSIVSILINCYFYVCVVNVHIIICTTNVTLFSLLKNSYSHFEFSAG